MVWAKARLASRLRPLTATSMGVGEPRLITRLTMSLGSNEKLTSGICSANFRRNRSFSSSMRTGAPWFNCTCTTPSSGPPFQR